MSTPTQCACVLADCTVYFLRLTQRRFGGHTGIVDWCMGCCNTCSRRAAVPYHFIDPQQPLPRRKRKNKRPIEVRPFQGRTLYIPARSRTGVPVIFDSDIGEQDIPTLSSQYGEAQVRDSTTQVDKWKRLVRHAKRLRRVQRFFGYLSEPCKQISPALSVSLHEAFPHKSLSDPTKFYKK